MSGTGALYQEQCYCQLAKFQTQHSKTPLYLYLGSICSPRMSVYITLYKKKKRHFVFLKKPRYKNGKEVGCRKKTELKVRTPNIKSGIFSVVTIGYFVCPASKSSFLIWRSPTMWGLIRDTFLPPKVRYQIVPLPVPGRTIHWTLLPRFRIRGEKTKASE